MEFKEARNYYVVIFRSIIYCCNYINMSSSMAKDNLIDLDQKQIITIKIFCDNIATIVLTKNLAFHMKTKHIET